VSRSPFAAPEVPWALLLDVVDRLESAEGRLLAWGHTAFEHSEEELLEHAEECLQQHGLSTEMTAEDVVDGLEDRRLVLNVAEVGKPAYRSRTAEAVRLFTGLRRMFRQHRAQPLAWQSAPPLVADFRWLRRERRYPRRDQAGEAAVRWIAPRATVRPFLEVLLDRGPGFLLSRFQLEAAKQILTDLDSGGARGSIVCAGTGSGKTLAFYLPALAHIAAGLDERRFARAVAIYPRNELLKDQFTSTWAEARLLDQELSAAGRRQLTMGAYFGPTPRDRDHLLGRYSPWQRVAAGWLCPYFRCPEQDCSGDMVWSEEDLRGDRHSLGCTRCGATTEPGLLVLTRERMHSGAPDLLFTSTEMLSRSMSDTNTGGVFGLFGAPSPSLLLLDEVHTYTGSHGAQVAYLLRRWRRALGAPVAIVGLSATLRGARSFLAELTGLRPDAVRLVEPREEDLIAEGRQYQLVLRGEPASGVSLVSTTLQAAMLLRRILEPNSDGRTGGLLGRRVFLFTDDLDVTNRLYFDLLDAEGRNSWGVPTSEAAGPLAHLRSSVALPRDDESLRFEDGQSWRLCEFIGHRLGPQDCASVSRTSSQDSGVAAASDVVVATASLEVGFNDPSVGAVLQHKAPRDAAQFVQRIGRAGRSREMRPWTVVTLGDFGRDRDAYDRYEELFDPSLRERRLPIRNEYVLRIQAAYTLMDWVAMQPAVVPGGSVWRDFAGPPAEHQRRTQKQGRQRQASELTLLEALLEDDALQSSLQRFLENRLGLRPETAQRVMWDPPRSLLLAVVPTIVRRLRSHWSVVAPHGVTRGGDFQVLYSPMPDFVPGSLFSALQLPEVIVETPPQQQGDEPGAHPMPLRQAMSALSPGAVSFRFTIRHGRAWHWIPPPDPFSSGVQPLSIESFCGRYDDLGHYSYRGPRGGAAQIRCLRPWNLVAQRVPSGEIHQASNAQPTWMTEILTAGKEPTEGSSYSASMDWSPLVGSVSFWTHSRRTPVTVRRFAASSRADILTRSGVRHTPTVQFVLDRDGETEPVALGFEGTADGVRIRLDVSAVDSLLRAWTESPAAGTLRVTCFQSRVLAALEAAGVHRFSAAQLGDVYWCALTDHAVERGFTGLAEAQRSLLADDEIDARLLRALHGLFGDGGEDEHSNSRTGLKRLAEHLERPEILTRLAAAAEVLWGPPTEADRRVVEDCLRATVGGAFLRAATRMCPSFGEGDLILDLSAGPTSEAAPGAEFDVWLTESSLGGGGIVEALAARVADEPRRLFQMAAQALEPSGGELTDAGLCLVLRCLLKAGGLSEAATAHRAAASFEETSEAMAAVRRGLRTLGLPASHALLSAVNRRLLRPGSGPHSDELTSRLLARWLELEAQLGVDLALRFFAYLVRQDPAIDSALGPAPPESPSHWRMSVVHGLLWPRGGSVRGQDLAGWNPYERLPVAEPLLLRSWLQPRPAFGLPATPAQAEEVRSVLASEGVLRLDVPADESAGLPAMIADLVMQEIEVDFLLLRPSVSHMRRTRSGVQVTLELPQARS